ncbi:MAG: site-specific integrase [Kiritimatiellae bacterium]|nr:site-specific integrase [Kiritimatiellia bacterium]
MLYKNNGGKVWWVMFRDPKRKGKFIRKSTGTSVLADARAIEQAEHLAIKGKLTEKQLADVFNSIFGKECRKEGLRLDQMWTVYQGFVRRRDCPPSDRMLRTRRSALDRFIEWAASEHGVSLASDITLDLALSYADHLKRRLKLKDKSRRNHISNLSSIWKGVGAIRDLRNPWTDVAPAVRDGVRHGAFTREQERAVLAAARKCPVPHWYEASLIARWTGLRKHDIALLEWKDVDLERGVIATTPIKTRGYGITVYVPMVKDLWDTMRGLYRRRRKYVLPDFAASYPKSPGGYEFSEVLKAAGVEDPTITFHSWRHTFRTRLAEAGVPDDLAKRLGGWTKDETVRRYDHADRTDEIRRAIASTSAARP